MLQFNKNRRSIKAIHPWYSLWIITALILLILLFFWGKSCLKVHKNEKNSKHLEMGFSKEEVLNIMGQPDYKISTNDKAIKWKYNLGNSIVTPKVLNVQFRENQIDSIFVVID